MLKEKIYECRKKLGLSQEELGELIGVTRQTISNWELGETAPNHLQLKKLSQTFGISIDELLDNDIHNMLYEKVSNTEKLASLILKIVKGFIFLLGLVFIIFIVLFLVRKYNEKNKDTGRLLEETIHCKLYGEEHTFSISYEEYTGSPVSLGGDTYFSDILDLGKYNDAHQIFNVINDYVKKNDGTCFMASGRDISDLVDISIKDGTLKKDSLTVIIKENIDYDIIYGETFWIEKYNYSTSNYEKLTYINDNCAFNLPAYGVTPDKPLELYQNWACMYGKLDKGVYRLVKDVSFESDTPIDQDDIYYIWVEFMIED